jgi:hypothetical protein
MKMKQCLHNINHHGESRINHISVHPINLNTQSWACSLTYDLDATSSNDEILKKGDKSSKEDVDAWLFKAESMFAMCGVNDENIGIEYAGQAYIFFEND